MEENQNQEVETETTQTEQVEKTVNEKTFTQDEFNEALAKAIKRKTKDMPSEEDLKKINEWKQSQQTEAEKLVEKEKEIAKITSEKDDIIYENIALKNGVKVEDLDYIIYKVSKQDGNFEDNLKSFLKENPKFIETAVQKATGVEIKGTSVEKETGVAAILKAKHPDLFN